MDTDNRSGYFAAKDAKETAEILLARAKQFKSLTTYSGYIDMILRSFAAYHGLDYQTNNGGHQINFGGEQGELVQTKVNHFRNIAQNMINLITTSRPTMEATALNTDSKSTAQAELANGLLEYYMREKRLEDVLTKAVEYAVVLGSGYVKLAWNATIGEVATDDDKEEIVNEETGAPIYEGDIEADTLSPFDVFVDSTKESQKHDWMLARTKKNKFDVSAKYPEYKDSIEAIKTMDKIEPNNFYIFGMTETSDIAVYEFYHNKTESLPQGRYILFLDDGVVLYDGPLPYKRIPIYRVSPADILGTPFGYTNMFDLLPLQDALDATFSTILSNQNAFGVQSLLVPSGGNVSYESLSGGLSFIECDFSRGKPEAINFTKTPKEVFDFLGITIQQMETISGMNAVIRGNPDASLRSGTSLALVQNNAIQFMNTLARQYNQLIEDVGTGIIQILQVFATTRRVAAIVGINKRSYLRRFSGEDLSNISRVGVISANPLTRTTSGKKEMASELLQYQLLKDPMQYLQIMQTGSLDQAVDDETKILNELQSENEALLNGEKPIAIIIDQHLRHIKKHQDLIGDHDMRKDPTLLENTLAHIQDHIDILFNPNPNIQRVLAMTNQQLPEMAQQMQMMQAPPQAPGPQGAPAPVQGQEPLPMPQGGMGEMPTVNDKLPKPAGNPEAPVTGEQAMQNIRQGG